MVALILTFISEWCEYGGKSQP